MLIARHRLAHRDYILQMPSPAMTPFVGGEPVEHSFIGGALHVGVQGGINAKPAFVDLVAAVLGFEIAANLLHKPRGK